jgi:hypothetical protein
LRTKINIGLFIICLTSLVVAFVFAILGSVGIVGYDMVENYGLKAFIIFSVLGLFGGLRMVIMDYMVKD